MKIAFVSHYDRNIELFRLPIILELLRKGLDVHVLVPEGARSQALRSYGFPLHHFFIERRSLHPLRELSVVVELRDILRKIDPDIVHSFMAKPNIYTTLAAKRIGISRIINSVTGLGSYYGDNSLRSRAMRASIEALYKFTLPSATKVVFQNPDDQDYFISHKLAQKEKTLLIPGSGIDLSQWNTKENTQKGLVTFIGRLIKQKGVEDFIEASKRIRENIPHARFRIIGSSDPGNRFSIHESFLLDFPWIEHIPWTDEIQPLLDETEVFLLPSYREGLPRSGLEALSLSKAVVCYDVPGCREIVNNETNGFLVPLGDIEQLSAQVSKLLSNNSLCMSFGKEGRKLCEQKFSLTQILTQHEQLYQSLL